jgi:hypothetical protein
VVGATDANGQAMAAHEWTFTTGDFSPPYVVRTEPANGAFGQFSGDAGQQGNAVVSAFFSEPLQGTTGVSFELVGRAGPVAGVLSYEALPSGGVRDPAENGWSGAVPSGALHFTPSTDLASDAVYTATVVGAWDVAGNHMTAPHTWHFTTESTVPFTVTLAGVGADAGAVGVPLTATLAVVYNKRLLPGSQPEVTFYLSRLDAQSGGQPVAGQVTMQGHSLRFTPDAPLEAGAVYQAYVLGATSYLGDRQTVPFRWAFETLTPDPPQVVRTEPVDGETGVARDAALTVFFDRALHVGGEEVEFRVEDPQGTPLAGHLTWVRGGEDDVAVPGRYTQGTYLGYRGLRFRPLAPLAEGTTYDVTVKGMENLAGAPMEAPYSWSLTTKSGPAIQGTPAPVVSVYYSHNGERVAMREIDRDGQDVLYWLVGDHPSATLRTGLGTTSLVLNADGSFHSEARHYPYGQERWSSGSLPTDYRFTGQRDTGLGGLYHMGARFYDFTTASAMSFWISSGSPLAGSRSREMASCGQ